MTPPRQCSSCVTASAPVPVSSAQRYQGRADRYGQHQPDMFAVERLLPGHWSRLAFSPTRLPVSGRDPALAFFPALSLWEDGFKLGLPPR